MRIAALADLHCNNASHEFMRPLFEQIAQSADVLLLCGDLIDYGLPEEAMVLAKQISSLKIPVLAVLGNHEFESGKQDEVKRLRRRPPVAVRSDERRGNGALDCCRGEIVWQK